MLNLLEEKTMVHQVHDTTFKPLDKDCRLKTNDTFNSQHKNQDITSSKPDYVNLSDTTKELASLKASLQDFSEINLARVLHFKNAIQTGQYQIHSDNIARKMLNTLETV